MRRNNQQSGFSAVEIIIVIVIVAVMGFLGYTFYNNYTDKAAKDTTAAEVETKEAPTITTSSDLDKASTAMDDSNLDAENDDDLSELDGAMAEL